MVKIDLGCHIDGYIAVAAHTLIVGYVPNPTAPITGPKADLFHAAYAVRFKNHKIFVMNNIFKTT